MPSHSNSSDHIKSDILPNVVSLDYCADQYVLSLADRRQIVAVSKAAEEPHSFYRDRAIGLPKTDSSIAEVILLHPDIAVQTYSAAVHMAEMTDRVGISLIKTNYGSGFNTMLGNLSLIGRALGQEERTDKLIQDYKVRLKKVESFPRRSLTIAYVTPSGYTAGAGTFVDDIIKLSGFTSYASVHHYVGWLPLPLEDLIFDPPDIFLTSFFDTNIDTQSNWSLSRHGRLLRMMTEIPTINLPGSFMACDGLFLIESVERIRAEAGQKKTLTVKQEVPN